MPLANAKRQKKYTEKLKAKDESLYKAKESKRRKVKRILNGEKVWKADREWQKKYRLKKATKNAINAAINESTVGSSTPYNAASTLGKAVKKAERALPLSPWKRTSVIKKLAMNSGISLESPSAKTKKITTNINDHVIEIVKNFYTKDDVLWQAPGKRDTVVVRENSERKTFQKHHLSMTIMEAYQIFKNEHTHISIGKSKFAELRAEYVLYSSDLPQNVCTCIYHENVMVILQTLHRIDSIYPLYSHDLPNKFVCFQPNDDYWFNKCN